MDGYTDAAEKASSDRYYVSQGGRPEQQVGKAEYVSAENRAGFRSKFGPDEVATSSFSSGTGESSIAGRIVYANGKPLSKGPVDQADTEQGPMQRSDGHER